MNEQRIRQELLERFTRYTAIDTQSSLERADAGIQPSSDGQRTLAELLLSELKALGIPDVSVDEHSYLLARIPPTSGSETVPPFGLCAHLDTALDAPGKNVRAQLHEKYDGTILDIGNGHILDPDENPELAECIGHTIITSDGTTLLGADNKAGIAGIMTLISILGETGTAHGPIEVVFSPDEETGHGMDRIPIEKLKSRAFYTVDGGAEGELETECFNAWKCEVVCTGVAAHPGTARGKMVNAVAMAASFVQSLPVRESPETTSGYEGFFYPLEMNASCEKAAISVYVRDFDLAVMERRLDRLDCIARAVEAQFPGGTVSVTRTRQYLNMKEKLDQVPEVLEILKTAATRAGVSVRMKPIRGGTDGSRLTEMGIPTPNIFTGGHNFHSRTEWASLDQMTAMVRTLVELTASWREYHV